MRLFEQLFRRLAEIVDESNDGVLLQRIFDAINVHVAFVEKRMEEVECCL
jgi:hypothetical protein